MTYRVGRSHRTDRNQTRLGSRHRRRLILLLLLLGCPAGERPKPPAPPVVVVPPTLPPIPVPTPPVTLLQLELSEDSIEVEPGGQYQLCAFMRLSTGRVAMPPGTTGICAQFYVMHYTELERALTPDEIAWLKCEGRYAADLKCRRMGNVLVRTVTL